jgi:hypothetical protein
MDFPTLHQVYRSSDYIARISPPALAITVSAANNELAVRRTGSIIIAVEGN